MCCIGDLAYTGMNTGIQDAHNLAWKLAAILNGISPKNLLNTYETERQPVSISLFLLLTH